jgi:hypothetical protein
MLQAGRASDQVRNWPSRGDASPQARMVPSTGENTNQRVLDAVQVAYALFEPLLEPTPLPERAYATLAWTRSSTSVTGPRHCLQNLRSGGQFEQRGSRAPCPIPSVRQLPRSSGPRIDTFAIITQSVPGGPDRHIGSSASMSLGLGCFVSIGVAEGLRPRFRETSFRARPQDLTAGRCSLLQEIEARRRLPRRQGARQPPRPRKEQRVRRVVVRERFRPLGLGSPPGFLCHARSVLV